MNSSSWSPRVVRSLIPATTAVHAYNSGACVFSRVRPSLASRALCAAVACFMHRFHHPCNEYNQWSLSPIRTRSRTAAEGKGKKNKNKRRLPQWAHEELKETAKRVREEHADPEGKGRQPEPQVGENVKFAVLPMKRIEHQVCRDASNKYCPTHHIFAGLYMDRQRTD